MPRLGRYRNLCYRFLHHFTTLFILNILLSLAAATLVLQERLNSSATWLAPHGIVKGQSNRTAVAAATQEKAIGISGGYTRTWQSPGASRLMIILLYADKFHSKNERIVSESVWSEFPFVTFSCERCYWLPPLTDPPTQSTHPWEFGLGGADVLESDATYMNGMTTPTTTPIPYRPEIGGLILNPLIYALVWLGVSRLRRWMVGRQRRRRGRCPKCGYSLDGIRVSICPECGDEAT